MTYTSKICYPGKWVKGSSHCLFAIETWANQVISLSLNCLISIVGTITIPCQKVVANVKRNIGGDNTIKCKALN